MSRQKYFFAKKTLEETCGIKPDKYAVLADELDMNNIVKIGGDGQISTMSKKQYDKALEYAKINAKRINTVLVEAKARKPEYSSEVKKDIGLLSGTMDALEEEIRRKIVSEEAINSMMSKILAITQVSLGIGIESAKCGMDWHIIRNIQQMRGSLMKVKSVQWFKDELKHYTENCNQLKRARLKLVELTNASYGINSSSAVKGVILENAGNAYRDKKIDYIIAMDEVKKEIASLEWRIEYVDRTLDKMITKDREIIRSIYLRGKHYNQVAEDIYRSERGLKKYVNKVIQDAIHERVHSVNHI